MIVIVELTWEAPPTYDVRTADGRLLRYCVYGPADGTPVIHHSGSPSTRWKRPDIIRATEESGVRLLVHDRPGYGGSTRQPGRTVADVVADVKTLAAAEGWERFAVAGASGGGPHALACAALLGDRVTRCAVSAGIAPPLVDGPEPAGDEADPRRNKTSWLAAQGDAYLRPYVEEGTGQIMASIEAGGPELLPDPDAPTPATDPPAPAKDSPASMARLRATFLDSHDGWIDDNVAFAGDWGFELGSINVPVSIRYGDRDERSRLHAGFLLKAVRTAELHPYEGGHIQDDQAYRSMLAWLRDGPVSEDSDR
jgi:pimeloyl-ACP methyl ester carboxylesterase